MFLFFKARKTPSQACLFALTASPEAEGAGFSSGSRRKYADDAGYDRIKQDCHF